MTSYENIVGYNNSKEGVKGMICNHYYFKDEFNYQPYVCNDFHDFSMIVMNLSDFFIISIKGNDYSANIRILIKEKL